MVLSLALSGIQAVLYEALAAWSSGFASRRLWLERFFSSSARISLSASSNQSWCFLVKDAQLQLWFPVVCLHLLPLFFRLCSCYRMKSLPQHDLKIAFHPWVMKSVCLQLLRLGSFHLGGDLKVKVTFNRTSLWPVQQRAFNAVYCRRKTDNKVSSLMSNLSRVIQY